LPTSAWLPATAIAMAFVVGQLCTYLAFQYGDVSLATPVFGVKIVQVAMISSLLADEGIALKIWIAAVLSAVGIAVIQGAKDPSANQKLSARRAAITIVLALSAATAFSLFDVGLQMYGRYYGPERFLATMFVLAGVFSCGLLPWCDRPTILWQRRAFWPVLMAAVLMAGQAMSVSYALGRFGDATRINIVYALRGLWSVLLAWLLSRLATSPEGGHSTRTMMYRLAGAILLLLAVVIALL